MTKKNRQKGGELNNNNKIIIKNLIGSGNSRLVFCDLRRVVFAQGVANFSNGISIIIVKKKNIINQQSNYYAIEINPENNNFEILAQGQGKESFYNALNSVKQQRSNKSALATKILIYFKLDWTGSTQFCEEFNDLNRYFMSRIP